LTTQLFIYISKSQ